MDLDMEDTGARGKAMVHRQTSEGKDRSKLQDAESDAGAVEFDGCRHSVPCFLRKVLREELDNDDYRHRLLVAAIHAVMLESGLVRFQLPSQTWDDGSHLHNHWPSVSADFAISMSCYTLPGFVADGSDEVESIVLEFRGFKHFLIVDGYLTKGKSGLHTISLDVDCFVPTMTDLMWANCGNKHGAIYGDNRRSSVFKFWKVVKDQLVSPLLAELMKIANLTLLPSLMCLPTELKLQILEHLDEFNLVRVAVVSSEFQLLSSRILTELANSQLPSSLMSLPIRLKLRILLRLDASDLSRVACLSSELRHLSSHNALWKQKFLSEFGEVKEMQRMWSWKLLYMKRKSNEVISRTFSREERFRYKMASRAQQRLEIGAWMRSLSAASRAEAPIFQGVPLLIHCMSSPTPTLTLEG